MDGPLPQRLVHYRVTKNIVYDIYKYLMTGGRSFDQPVTAARITIKLREHGGGCIFVALIDSLLPISLSIILFLN